MQKLPIFSFISCNFLVRMQGHFQKKIFFFAHENITNWPQKLHTYSSLDFLFSTAPTAQNSPRLETHIGNVSQDTSVL